MRREKILLVTASHQRAVDFCQRNRLAAHDVLVVTCSSQLRGIFGRDRVLVVISYPDSADGKELADYVEILRKEGAKVSYA